LPPASSSRMILVMSRGRSRVDWAKMTRVRVLALLLVGVLFLCHGVFGVLHLCPTPLADVAAQQAGHEHSSSGSGANSHEHQACHLLHAADYYAVLLAAFLWLVFGLLLLKGARLWSTEDAPAASFRRFRPVVLHPPRCPTLPVLQVFRL
jgi:hypothetical protein